MSHFETPLRGGPIRFERDVHTAVWGEEEWLISARPGSPGVIAGGGGETLLDVAPDFPLLIKRIRAEKRLSVQVHPDTAAAAAGGEPKAEMWCILSAGPIFAGFKPGTTRRDVMKALDSGTLESLLVRIETRPGECYFIPGGMVHSIGEGTSVYEVQQSSDTTFRLYDWGRNGSDGKPRPLHVAEAFRSLDVGLPPPLPQDSVRCPYFSFSKSAAGGVAASEKWRAVYVPATGDSFLLPPGPGVEVRERFFLTTT
ncbi:MAG: class I mannose-6-phosphate isomerase [Kiritimatiellae bacterium]|nr:class I mannose-6-phosphate isomerase [Kiritimatiellia bacterium]